MRRHPYSSSVKGTVEGSAWRRRCQGRAQHYSRRLGPHSHSSSAPPVVSTVRRNKWRVFLVLLGWEGNGGSPEWAGIRGVRHRPCFRYSSIFFLVTPRLRSRQLSFALRFVHFLVNVLSSVLDPYTPCPYPLFYFTLLLLFLDFPLVHVVLLLLDFILLFTSLCFSFFSSTFFLSTSFYS